MIHRHDTECNNKIRFYAKMTPSLFMGRKHTQIRIPNKNNSAARTRAATAPSPALIDFFMTFSRLYDKKSLQAGGRLFAKIRGQVL